MSQPQELLAQRLNSEPGVFKGCSSTELGFIVAAMVLLCLPVDLLIAWWLGAPSMGLGIAGITIVLGVVISASVLGRLKRGRPDGYYQQIVTRGLAKTGVLRSPYIDRDGDWSVGRQTRVPGT